MAILTFADTQLQACFERNFADTEMANELRQVRALLDTYDWFKMLEGSHS